MAHCSLVEQQQRLVAATHLTQQPLQRVRDQPSLVCVRHARGGRRDAAIAHSGQTRTSHSHPRMTARRRRGQPEQCGAQDVGQWRVGVTGPQRRDPAAAQDREVAGLRQLAHLRQEARLAKPGFADDEQRGRRAVEERAQPRALTRATDERGQAVAATLARPVRRGATRRAGTRCARGPRVPGHRRGTPARRPTGGARRARAC